VSIADLTPVTLALGVRPPRVAIAVPMLEGFEWQRVFESAIAAQSRVWGGSGNLVFPLDGNLESNELLWTLLDLFDPDLLLTAKRPSVSEWPSKYSRRATSSS
jgi:hypothetical protein